MKNYGMEIFPFTVCRAARTDLKENRIFLQMKSRGNAKRNSFRKKIGWEVVRSCRADFKLNYLA